MTSILVYLMNRYGKDYKQKTELIRGDHRYGIWKYEMRIHGKNEKQIKVINDKKHEIKNFSNKQKLDMVMLQHLKEKEKEDKLDDSDDDDDNMIREMEEMMSKENIGENNKMKVPSKDSVEKSIGKDAKEKNGKNEEKRKKSIFEKNEKEVVDKAKMAIKELEMLVEKRIEMKKKRKKEKEIKKEKKVIVV